jgi:hypothetical protein
LYFADSCISVNLSFVNNRLTIRKTSFKNVYRSWSDHCNCYLLISWLNYYNAELYIGIQPLLI